MRKTKDKPKLIEKLNQEKKKARCVASVGWSTWPKVPSSEEIAAQGKRELPSYEISDRRP